LSNRKTASSQATWALLTEGVTRARLESHRIRHMVNRVLKLIEESDKKDHIYQMAGDVIVGVPERMDQLDVSLDRTGLALSKLGEEFLDARLSISDKQMVEEAISSAFGKPKNKESVMASSDRVASRYLDKQAALNWKVEFPTRKTTVLINREVVRIVFRVYRYIGPAVGVVPTYGIVYSLQSLDPIRPAMELARNMDSKTLTSAAYLDRGFKLGGPKAGAQNWGAPIGRPLSSFTSQKSTDPSIFYGTDVFFSRVINPSVVKPGTVDPRRLMGELVRIMKDLGYRKTSFEARMGASRTWMDRVQKGIPTTEAVLETLKKKYPSAKLVSGRSDRIWGPEFDLILNDGGHTDSDLVIRVLSNNKKWSDMEREGIDTPLKGNPYGLEY